MSGTGSLRSFVITLLILTVIYALALMLLIPIAFLIGAYLISLLGNELFTQGDFFLFQGMFFIIISGTFDLIAVMVMSGYNFFFKEEIDELPSERNQIVSRTPYVLLFLGMIFSYGILGTFIIDKGEGYAIFTFFGIILFIFLFLKWKIIDIPAKALLLLGNENGLKWGRISAIPFLILLFSFFSLLISFRFEEAPTGTIILVYLEILFALSVLINLFSIGGIVKALKGEISHIEKNGMP